MAIKKVRIKNGTPIDVNDARINGIDSTPTLNSTNVVMSGGVKSALDGITEKIPAQASSTNQLADKAFVNSSIETATADFKGTFNSLAELEEVTANKNDYGFVISTDASGNTVYNRYKYNGTEWLFEYSLNNSSFTAAQWAAIQSGITSALVTKLNGIAEGAEVNVQSDWNAESGDAFIKNKPQNLVQDADYVHTDNNYTTTEKNKLGDIESGAQANVIDGVKVNGVAQTITDKKVDILIPVENGTGENSMKQKGGSNTASGISSSALGASTTASGNYSHAEGFQTSAGGLQSHTEGIQTQTQNTGEHAEGAHNVSNKASDTYGNAGNTIHSVGIGVAGARKNAHEIMQNGDHYIYGIGGYDGTNPSSAQTVKQVIDAKQDGITDLAQIRAGATAGATAYQLPQGGIPARDMAPGVIPDVSQFITKDVDNLTNYPKTTTVNQAIDDALDSVPFAEGSGTDSAEQWNCMASGDYSVATGYNTTAKGQASHSEGNNTNAAEQNSHAEGYRTTANGANAHIEGRSQNKPSDETIAKGNDALIADWNTKRFSLAKGNAAHAEGYNNLALGNYTHAEGAGTIAISAQSHAEGNFTKTTNTAEHAEGNWNKSNTNTLHSVGIGGSEATRKNAHEIMQNGDHYIYGIGGYDGTNPGIARRIQDALMQCTGVKNIISLTKAEYDALANKDSETIYVVDVSPAYVDLGLRDGNDNKILFATCNIGASAPQEYGDYFAWGETSKRYISIENNTIVGGSFEWSNCPYHTGGSAETGWSKYIPTGKESYGTPDNKLTLEAGDDVASALWGGSWRMPDKSDLEYLFSSNVTYEWTSDYNGTGVAGFKITGKGSFSSASLFLPAAGYCDVTVLYGAGGCGYYWSRSVYSGYPYLAWGLYFGNGGQNMGNYNRYYGPSVRPVHVGDVVPSYKLYKGSAPINKAHVNNNTLYL